MPAYFDKLKKNLSNSSEKKKSSVGNIKCIYQNLNSDKKILILNSHKKIKKKEKKKKEMKSCLYPNNKNDRKWDKKTL